MVDAEGRYINTPVNADESNAAKKPPVYLPEQWKLSPYKLTPTNKPQIKNADKKATEIFGLANEPSRKEVLERLLVADCCDELQNDFFYELEMEDSPLIEMNFMSQEADFATGTSKYEIAKLASSRYDYFLRVRTFIDDVVFVPSLVFLDENFHPVRHVDEISFSYKKADWHSYGHLEAILDVRYASKDERYVLIFTTDRAQEKYTIVEGLRGKLIQIPHAQNGSLELYPREF